MDEMPLRILPMLATLAKSPPDGDSWAHEIKLDGFRLLLRRDGERVGFYTRNGHDWSARFPAIADSIRQLPANRIWLDGELVTMLSDGRSCFGSLQEAVAKQDQECLAYYAFDLLHLDGRSLLAEPLLRRKELLSELLGAEEQWNLRYVDHVIGAGPEFFAMACDLKLEGIVSKRVNSPYRPELRSPDWLKTKCSSYHEHRRVAYKFWEETAAWQQKK